MNICRKSKSVQKDGKTGKITSLFVGMYRNLQVYIRFLVYISHHCVIADRSAFTLCDVEFADSFQITSSKSMTTQLK